MSQDFKIGIDLSKGNLEQVLASLTSIVEPLNELKLSVSSLKEKMSSSEGGKSNMDDKKKKEVEDANAAQEAAAALAEAEAKKAKEGSKEEEKKESKEEEDKEKKAGEADAAKAALDEAEAKMAKEKKDKEDADAAVALAEAEAKKVKDAKDADDAKAAKEAKEKEDKEKADAATAAALIEAEAAKVCAMKMDKSVCAKAGFSEAESSLASSYSYGELVKMLASLSLEVASYREEKKKAESAKATEVKFEALASLGLAFVGEKAVAQKVKLSVMDEKTFESYKEDLATIKESITTDSGSNTFKKAQEELGRASASVSLAPKDLKEQFMHIG